MDDVEPRVRTDGFARDVAAMRRELEDGLGAGADRAGRAVETALLRAVRSGKLGFEDLKRSALGVLDGIAAAAVRQGLSAIVAGIAGGQPGRATGGPVKPGAAYVVGERGPELFVPTSSGSVVANGAGGARTVNVNIRVDGGEAAPERLARSSRQVARAVRAALAED
ncbi:MAG TPA: tail tape measure protein [Sphingomonas sp.]|jgi:phage-related minor tail protein|nr:tail tape measure protein [Sphingomonas sp.]